MSKVVKSCHQLTWSLKKRDQKEREIPLKLIALVCLMNLGAKVFCSLVKRRVKN